MIKTRSRYHVEGGVVVGSVLEDFSAQWQSPDGQSPETHGFYELWTDAPTAEQAQYYAHATGSPVWNEAEQRVDGAWSPEQQRAVILNDINAQVPDATVAQSVRDPLVEADIARYLAAATDKSIELQDTAAEDLGTFDPTLDVAPPQNGKGYSQFAVDIRELEPWAGAPDNTLGFEAVLNVQTEYEDQGAEARLYVIDAPSDSGAVLPFVVDAEDPSKWIATSRDGNKWADPDMGCRVQLLWGAGSLPTSSKLQCKGQNDRQAQLVRYAVPTARARSKRK